MGVDEDDVFDECADHIFRVFDEAKSEHYGVKCLACFFKSSLKIMVLFRELGTIKKIIINIQVLKVVRIEILNFDVQLFNLEFKVCCSKMNKIEEKIEMYHECEKRLIVLY